MIHIKKFTFNPFQENTYVVYNDQKECFVLDPGNQKPTEDQELFNFIEEEGLTPIAVLNTHTHLDHIFGNLALVETYNIPLYAHEKDKEMYYSAGQIAQLYGMPPFEIPDVDIWWTATDETFYLGDEKFDLLFTPGHSPGEICLYHKASGILLAGDVLFYQSIGRTDLPGGDHKTLIDSIKTKLLPLPDKTIVYCGHGPETTIGFERKNNMFLQ